MKSALRFLAIGFALGFVFVGAAFAQGTGTITGTVKDPKDALIAKATVTARNTQTNISRTTQTDDDGRYRMEGLPVGPYEVSVESSGFAKFTQTGIGLDVNQIAVVDVAMNPEGVSGGVTAVEQNATVLKSSNAEVSTRFDSRRVSELPLAPNRNVFNVALGAPGVSQLGSGQAAFSQGVQFSANGGRTR